jgi:superfamily II DNA helicase RecQ
MRLLNLRQPAVFVAGFNRPNLFFKVVEKPSKGVTQKELVAEVRFFIFSNSKCSPFLLLCFFHHKESCVQSQRLSGSRTRTRCKRSWWKSHFNPCGIACRRMRLTHTRHHAHMHNDTMTQRDNNHAQYIMEQNELARRRGGRGAKGACGIVYCMTRKASQQA